MSANQLTGKTTITKPGQYVLAKDIDQGGGTRLSEACIRIEADDVVLDGRGRLLRGNGVSDTTGIVAAGVQNVTIRNVTLSDWDYGIRLEGVNGGRIHSVQVVKNGYGLSVTDADDVSVAETRIAQNVLGVVFDAASTAQFRNSTVESNGGKDVYRPPGTPE